ncbi:hypothetical protein AB6813_08135 [bacterium RCC_150]
MRQRQSPQERYQQRIAHQSGMLPTALINISVATKAKRTSEIDMLLVAFSVIEFGAQDGLTSPSEKTIWDAPGLAKASVDGSVMLAERLPAPVTTVFVPATATVVTIVSLGAAISSAKGNDVARAIPTPDVITPPVTGAASRTRPMEPSLEGFGIKLSSCACKPAHCLLKQVRNG